MRGSTSRARCRSRPGSSFGTWLGWVVEPDRPIVLLVEDHADLDDLARQALRIGFEPFLGYVDGGFEAWCRAGRPVEAGTVLTVDDAGRRCSRPAGRRRRSSSMSASRPSTRPATSRARPTSGRASCRRSSTDCRAIARSPRSAPAAIARASRRRCFARPGSRMWPPSPTASRPGRHTASRSNTGPRAGQSTGPPRPPLPARPTALALRAALSRPGSRRTRARRPRAGRRRGRQPARPPPRPARSRCAHCGARPSAARR